MKRRTYSSIDAVECTHVHNAGKGKRRSLNPLRSDPSQTATLRRALVAHVKARFARIRSDLIKLIWKDNALGLKEQATENTTDNAKRSKMAERILKAAKEQSEAKEAAEAKEAKSSGDNCGVGASGFQPGNTCAAGGGSHDVQADVGSITRAFKDHEHSKHNIVHLGDLRDALGWDRDRFQAAVKAGRLSGVFVGKIHEGRHGATERDKQERTDDDKLYIGLKLAANVAEECPQGECCPHCGARLERDPYSGKCNSCGKDWPVENVFCSTGEGGGVDPTCSPSSRKVQLGYTGDDATIPDEGIAKKVLTALDSAVAQFEKVGVDVTGLHDIKIVTSDEAHGGAYATGSGLTHKYNAETEKQFEKVYSSTRTARENGEVPEFAFESMEDRMIHEIGHNIGRKLSSKDSKKWEKLAKEYGTDVDHLPSFYAQENSSELWAESVLAVVKGYQFGGTARNYGPKNPAIEDFVRSKLGLSKTTNTVNAARWGQEPNPRKVEQFQKWLKQQFKNQVTSDNERAFWEAYTRRGFEKGAGRSFDDVKGTRWGAGEGDFYDGTKEQFLKDSFAQPVAIDKVKLIAGRSFSDLEGVTEAASTKMVRSLADGLVEGKSPRDIAKDLSDDLEGIGRNRALTIARTEIISAHAEGQLIALEQLGVKEVGAMVEWSVTTGPDGEPDDRVCELCLPLDGMVLSIDEARGMLPRHPNCRCAWIPAKVGEDDEGQKEGAAMRAAIRDSFAKESGEEVENADYDEHLHKLYDGIAEVSTLFKKTDPLVAFDVVVNTFCSTGEGGGQDNS